MLTSAGVAHPPCSYFSPPVAREAFSCTLSVDSTLIVLVFQPARLFC